MSGPTQKPTSPVLSSKRDDDATAPVGLGAVGWLRWGWRQLTSMRTALLLLLALAVAAIPGSVLPQRLQDRAAVTQWIADNGSLGEFLDSIQMFDVYSSVWFSAIYLLLFTSLVGCILPRIRVHVRQLRSKPPRVPVRFTRFPVHEEAHSADEPEVVAERVVAQLRGPLRFLPRFRVAVTRKPAAGDKPASTEISAERGYLRETGNILFHLGLVGVLIAMAYGQLAHYRAQAIVIEGRSFANSETSFDTMEQGAFFDAADLIPFTIGLDDFYARFDEETKLSRDFRAEVTITDPQLGTYQEQIRVNHPIVVAGTKVYLQGNGYAPQLRVYDSAGQLAKSDSVIFLPQDTLYTSRGVVKVPDVTAGEQLALVGYLLPTAMQNEDGFWYSDRPELHDPALILGLWTGDLGIDQGLPQNEYLFDPTNMTQISDGGQLLTIVLRPGESFELPGGLGEVHFDGVDRFVALDLRADPSLTLVLVSALVAITGLMLSLFTPRRRVWLRITPVVAQSSKVEPSTARTRVAIAGLARGDDLGLADEVAAVLAAGLAAPDHSHQEQSRKD